MVQVGPDLGKLAAVEGAGVEVHQGIAVLHDLGKKGVGDAGRHAALGVAGKITVQVPPVRQIAGSALKALQIDDGHADDGPSELADIEVVDQPADDFNAIELVTVDGRGQAEGGPGAGAVDHQHRCRHGDAGKGQAR